MKFRTHDKTNNYLKHSVLHFVCAQQGLDIDGQGPDLLGKNAGSYLKKVFWPDRFVGCAFQILDILAHGCG